MVEAGHLRGFAADEGAVVFGTGAGEAFDDVGEDVRLKFARAEIVEEEKRLRAEHGNVIDAMVHEVRADGVVLVHSEGDFELRAHTVHAADEDWLAIFLEVELEEAAEAAGFAEHFASVRAGEQLRERRLDFIAQIDVHARAGVSLLFHARAVKRQSEIEASEKANGTFSPLHFSIPCWTDRS